MGQEHKERLLAQLDALKLAIKKNDIPDDMLDAIHLELSRLANMLPAGSKTHAIAELKGLGKEVWQSIDVDEYIREERRSWR